MAITNGYCTLPQLTGELNIKPGDVTYDVQLESAINSASREIDGKTGRRFWQDGTVVAREFYPVASNYVEVDDISTVTGLIVKIDSGDDGTFATTLAIGTDFLLQPRNAAAEVPVRPYTSILALGTYWFPCSTYGRATVQVTAKFGWPAVPPDVERACLIQAAHLYKATQASASGFEISGEGIPMRTARFHPQAEALLEPYVKSWVG